VLDDMRGPAQDAMAATVHRLSHPGSLFLMWCFYDEIPWWKHRGGRFPGLAEGGEQRCSGRRSRSSGWPSLLGEAVSRAS
jgi:hypothetical protein